MNQTTANRYLAYFDIMGFKDLSYRESHDTVHKMMSEFSKIIQRYERMNQNVGSRGVAGLLPNDSGLDLLVSTVVFSDTVLLYSRNDSEISLSSLMAIAAFFFSDCIEKGIPIKGAISEGVFTADKEKSLYFGRPLIDAYNLTEEMAFYGAVLHHSAHKTLKYIPDYKYFTAKVPLKTGNVTHTVLSLTLPELLDSASSLKPCFEAFYETSSGSVRRYVDNSLAVYEDHF
ncbi:MAG: hypothetical protein Q8K17_01385 [Pseudohongiella sp.]|nr:hypothetical protein [Pseudohongiella sp.]MDP2091627.1 hypothetical protein [Pseudohongiella sp.]